jgi:hypothetical protein
MELKLKYKYLDNENERIDGAKILVDRYQHLKNSKFSIVIGPFNKKIESKIERYIKAKVQLNEYQTKSEGIIFKKRVIHATTKEIEITEEQMFVFSEVTFDLVLAYSVRTEILPIEENKEAYNR